MIVYRSCPNCGDKNISKVLSAKDYTVSGENFEIWECKNCTQRFTQNIPEVNDIGRYYQSENYISHSDTSKGFVNNLYHKVRKRTLVKKRKLIEEATGKTKGNILDVGAGTGAFLNTMKNAGWNCTGIEPDNNARKKALELYGLDLKESKKLFLLPSKSFDAITLWHVLEHVHELHSYVEQLKNLLTTDGKLFIAVPNYTSADAKMYGEFWAAYDVPRHLYHFSPKAMKTLLNAHGLKLETIKPMWYDSVYVSLLSEKYKTGKSNPAKAFTNGMISNAETVFNKTKCSSLIYIASLK
ncbi:MAG: class I SAM-dependent methyltransferase [Bacteroidota bacterium]|nr:class I SAM-dependent methyltransferase [Bacteroidota bacterium]